MTGTDTRTVGDSGPSVKQALEGPGNCPYPQSMTESLEAAVGAVAEDLDGITDPADRFQATRETEKLFDAAMKGVRKRIALQLKQQMTWREVGKVMGDVSPQRAEQISRGA